jgi:hypothetical protein
VAVPEVAARRSIAAASSSRRSSGTREINTESLPRCSTLEITSRTIEAGVAALPA